MIETLIRIKVWGGVWKGEYQPSIGLALNS